MKIYITAQALQKNEIMQNVHRKTLVIIEHMLKLMIMPNHSARNHWQGEIAGQLNRITLLKSTKKFPSSDNLLKWTYYDNEDSITDFIWLKNELDNIHDEYGVEYDGDIYRLAETFQNICYKYFSWLAEQLSLNGSIRNRDIYQKLDELF